MTMYRRWQNVPNHGGFTVAAHIAGNEDTLLYNQRGPTCGIYALWKALDSKGVATPPPTKNGAGGSSLRSLAKANGLTKIGELFDADQVPALAALAGYKDAAVIDLGGKNADELFYWVKWAVDKNRFAMMAFSVDMTTGMPYRTGDHPHWCLLFGYRDTNREIAVTHWNRFFVFTATDLWDSNTRLQPFPKSTWAKPEGGRISNYSERKWYHIGSTARKVNFAKTDLAHALGWKLVVI